MNPDVIEFFHISLRDQRKKYYHNDVDYFFNKIFIAALYNQTVQEKLISLFSILRIFYNGI